MVLAMPGGKAMKSKPEPCDCELCGAVEPSPGSFPRCEGFIACARCVRNRRPKLASMRKRLDELSLGLIIGMLMGCGGAPFALIDGTQSDAGNQTTDAGWPEPNHDTGVVKLPHESGFAPPDVSDSGTQPDAADDTAETAVDADVDTAVCTPITPELAPLGACGGTSAGLRINVPSEYCLYIIGSPDRWSAATTPTACRCYETYDCACLAAAMRWPPCPAGTTLISCNAPANPGGFGQNGLGIQCR
jgi:hypothetical protein